jgi:hypothetical protein
MAPDRAKVGESTGPRQAKTLQQKLVSAVSGNEVMLTIESCADLLPGESGHTLDEIHSVLCQTFTLFHS